MTGCNWHTVAGYGVLLVECKDCGRRGALRKEDVGTRMHQGNMREINREKFKCRKCGGTEVRAYLPKSQDQVEMFLAGRSDRHDATGDLSRRPEPAGPTPSTRRQ